MGSLYESFGIKCTADSAFTGRKFDFIVKSGLLCRAATIEEACLMDEATSMRQSAEWGMKLYQAAYPRVKDRLKFHNPMRNYHLVLLTALITNYRTSKVGINQILNAYMPHLNNDATEYFGNLE